jgi:hypothetical protein
MPATILRPSHSPELRAANPTPPPTLLCPFTGAHTAEPLIYSPRPRRGDLDLQLAGPADPAGPSWRRAHARSALPALRLGGMRVSDATTRVASWRRGP